MKSPLFGKHMRFLIPAVLTALLVLDGFLGYVAPDPFDGIELITQTASAAEPPELALEEANEERVTPKGTAGKLKKVEENAEYNDGVYTGSATGFGGKITVKVTIKDGKIKSIKIVSAPGETGSYLSRASVVAGRIVKAQSTNVDAVSGATYSSNGIIKAVRNALAKAAKKKSKKKKTSSDNDTPAADNRTPEKPDVISGGDWKDGTYIGEGEGFSGKLHVKVTIEDGKITALELVDSNDDSEYMSKARPGIFDSVISTQSTDVDAVTGATFSSYGLMEAINDALSKAADSSGGSGGGGSGTDPGTDDPDKEYKDGTYTVTASCIREDMFDYDIIVTLTVKEGRLSSLSVSKGEDRTGDDDDIEDNDYYLSRAANGTGGKSGMIDRILSAQSADVDTVTGATFSSRSIKSAVSGILKDIETEKVKTLEAAAADEEAAEAAHPAEDGNTGETAENSAATEEAAAENAQTEDNGGEDQAAESAASESAEKSSEDNSGKSSDDSGSDKGQSSTKKDSKPEAKPADKDAVVPGSDDDGSDS